MSEKENNPQQDTSTEEVEKIPGSRTPFVIVDNLKTCKAIDAALERIRVRFEYIKMRNLEIQESFKDPMIPAYKKKELYDENQKLSLDVPKLIKKQNLLHDKRPKIETSEQEELAGMQISEIEVPV